MATGDNLSTEIAVSLSKEQAATFFRDDLDYLATTLLPGVAIYPFPEFYKIAWAYILQNLHQLTPEKVFRFALGLPRANCKTTFLKLLVCYLLMHVKTYDLSFILVVCATEPLAENFLDDVDQMMQNPLITQLYGNWDQNKTRNTKKIKRANFQGKSIILAAIGAQTSTRGLNIDNRRPNIILNDDVQTKENDESATERASLLKWLTGTLFKLRTKVEKSAIFYIGNMYSTDCILYKFSKIANWNSLITGSILADGSVLWPELNSLDELLEEYAHDSALGEGDTWFAEVQNDPIGASIGLLDVGESIPLYKPIDEAILELYPIRFITIDPAAKNKTSSDDNVIACHALMEEEKGCTLEIDEGKYDPLTVIKHAIRMAIQHKAGIIFVESVAYQSTLAFWFDQILDSIDLSIKVIPIPTGRASKFQRIKSWVKRFVHDNWYIVREQDYNKVTFQIYSYRLKRSDNIDDILDVEAQAILALNKHYEDILNATAYIPTDEEEPDLPVIRNNSYLDNFTMEP